MVKLLILFVTVVHGLIHLLGFVKAFNLAPVEQLSQEISKATGLFWLLATLLFLATAILYLLKIDSWWMVGAAAIIISQILIIGSWTDAKYGTIANLILIVPIIAAFMGQLPSSYENKFKTEVKKRIHGDTAIDILTEEDIRSLPAPVQKYVRYTGAVGKEKVHNFRAVFRGQFKMSPDSENLNVRTIQYNFFDQPARIFFMESKMYGIPLAGLHLYAGGTASMQIAVSSLLEVVNARGAEMNKSETVTFFNDMCFLAPATLIDKNIEWQTIDSTQVRARYFHQGNTISATLFFNDRGELVNFSSDDRSISTDGKSFENYRWTTPLSNYRDMNGRKVASHGEAVWHKPDGEYTYAKIDLLLINYNDDEMAWIK